MRTKVRDVLGEVLDSASSQVEEILQEEREKLAKGWELLHAMFKAEYKKGEDERARCAEMTREAEELFEAARAADKTVQGEIAAARMSSYCAEDERYKLAQKAVKLAERESNLSTRAEALTAREETLRLGQEELQKQL